MTRRATFTTAELVRAIRAAETAGKVALQTPPRVPSMGYGGRWQMPPVPVRAGRRRTE